MKEKAFGLLLSVGLFTAVGAAMSPALTNPTAFLADDSCSHVGYEYDGLPLTQEEYGVKPYFVCCKCNQHFINEGSAPAGNWTKSTLTLDEYKEVNERYTFMSEQLTDVEKSKNELTKLISELTDKMSNRFREQFAKINQYFDETFRELFDGGKAEIVLEDPTDVLESNIDIKLQPPGKNVKRLDALSGGEKGLSAIALLFAILKVNPAPFCIFDEVEAALDDSNVGRYAQYVRRMTKNTQFILITHRRGTMEEADILYGITMQEQGVSKLLELKTAEMAKRLGIS